MSTPVLIMKPWHHCLLDNQHLCCVMFDIVGENKGGIGN